MSKRFTDLTAVAQYVKDHVDLLKIITEDTGKRVDNPGPLNNKICCPFHNENTPSFNINTRLREYQCFSCKEKGDAIGWYRAHHGVDFNEAIDILSHRFSIDISAFIRPATKEELVKERYQLIFTAAAEWCHTQLMNHGSLLAEYRDDTGFEEEKVIEYKIGYCSSTDSLTNFLFSKISGITADEIRRLELDNKMMFNDALVYPVMDLSGRVSRIYTKPLHPPPNASYKYLGTTANHPLFRRDLVYGLFQMKRYMRQNNHHVVLTEGFKTSIAAVGVASMGTSVSDEQIKALHEAGVRSLTICYDGDQAGFQASLRIIDELHRFKGFMLRIARMPMDTQCDTLVKVSGRAALEAVLKNATLPIEYLVSGRYDIHGNMSAESRFQLHADILPILCKMPEVNAEISAGYLATILQVSAESIMASVRDEKAKSHKLFNQQAEEAILHHVIINAEKWVEVKTGLIDDSYFVTSEHQSIFKAIDAAYIAHQTSVSQRLILDKLGLLFPKDVERLSKRLDALAVTDVEYEFDTACTLVQDLWQRRTAIKQTQDLQLQMMDMSKTPNDALQSFRKKVISVVEFRRQQAITPNLVAKKSVELIEKRMVEDKKIIGYDFSSRLPVLNMALSGIQPAHQIIIAANQGVGKSLLAQNIIIPIAIEQQVPTLWINQEMVDVDINLRIISAMAGIHNSRLQHGKFNTTEEYYRFKDAETTYGLGQLYIRSPESGTIDEIYAIIEEMKFKYDIKVVVWDYLQLVGQSKSQNGMQRDQIYGEASNVMTNKVAHGLGIASVCISQLNRTGFKKGEIREAESVGGAYKIAQDADDFITIAEKDIKQIEQDGKQRGNRIIFVDKRRGGTSNIVIHANLQDKEDTTLRFSECVTHEEMIGYANQFGI